MTSYIEGQKVRLQGVNRNKKVVVYDFEYVGQAPSNRHMFLRGNRKYMLTGEGLHFANEANAQGRHLLLQVKDVTNELVVDRKMTLECDDHRVGKFFHETQFPFTPNGDHVASRWTLNGKRFPRRESSGTHASVENLKWLIERIGTPFKIEQKGSGEDVFVLFTFQHEGIQYQYIAAGFCVGYTGTGPNGLTEIAWVAGFGEATEIDEPVRPGRPPRLWDSRYRNLLSKVAATLRNFTGVLWERPRPLVGGRRVVQVFDGEGVL